MKLAVHSKPAKFIERLTRFSCIVELEGKRFMAHVANSGRMRELLVPDRPVYLVERPGTGRKTPFDLALVALEDSLISVDARLPSELFREAFLAGMLPQFGAYTDIQREVVWGDSRMDFLLCGDGSCCLVEVKSVTLVKAGRALFPDAPTDRGRRHIATLVEALNQGARAAVVFVVQRCDAQLFSPNVATDPEFAAALTKAAEVGVGVYVYGCQVSLGEITICCELPVEFKARGGLP